jgi:hypothetical protein
MALFKDYSPPVLEWQELRARLSLLPLPSDDSDSSSISKARYHLGQAVHEHEKKWLLKKGQDVGLMLPPSHLDDLQKVRIYTMADFVLQADKARDLDVQVCAQDKNGNGNRIQLSEDQLQQVHKTGEFRVDSILFENQHHIWKVAPGFYSGIQTRREELGQDVGTMLDHAVVYTTDAIVGGAPSLKAAIVDGIGGAFQIILGVLRQSFFLGGLRHRAYSEDTIAKLLELAEQSYVQHHLFKAKEGYQYDVRRLCDDSSGPQRELLWDILEEHWDGAQECRVTDDFRRQANREARGTIAALRLDFDGEDQGMAIELDERKARQSPIEAISERNRAQKEWRKKRREDWKDKLRLDVGSVETMNELDRILAEEVERFVVDADEEAVREHLVTYKNKTLPHRHPFLSLSKKWVERKLDAEKRKIMNAFEKNRLGRVATRLQETGLPVQAEARALAIKFECDHKSDITNKLHSVETPFPPLTFSILQLNPKNWRGDGGCIKHKEVEVDLGKPFWRVHYTRFLFVGLFKSMIGGSYHFLVRGPLSFRAMFGPCPYYAIRYPSPDPASLTPTLASRLHSFYQSLGQARNTFESTPDRGLIGKSIQRIFLRGYLTMKCMFGTAVIVSFMTIGTFIASTCNAIILASSPVLAALYTIAVTVFNLVVYDTALNGAHNRLSTRGDSFSRVPSEQYSSVSPVLKLAVGVPYYLVFHGVLQSILASLKIVWHPVIAALQLVLSSFRYSLRTVRDTVTWPLIRNYSRIPAENTFLAWRIHGPGLAAKEYYRLPLEAAKASVLVFLDRYRLNAHATVRKEELDAPYKSYRKLFLSAVEPFGIGITMNVPSPSAIGLKMEAGGARPLDRFNQRRGLPFARTGIHEHILDDIWDVLAKEICSSHPDYTRAQQAQVEVNWNQPIMRLSGRDLGEIIRDLVEASYEVHKSKGTLEMDEMVNRAAKVWATLKLHLRIRDQQLATAIAIPAHAAGRFRWSIAEQNELWDFTLRAVETFGTMLKEELQIIQAKSEFSEHLEPYVQQVADAFYTKSGARPGQDIPTIASYLLVQLLGGENMLESLEDIDEALVLHPKMAAEDEHLKFWKSMVF